MRSSFLNFLLCLEPSIYRCLSVGDPFVGIIWSGNALVGDGLTEHVFECSAGCSSVFANKPVTVIREHLHMHETGYAMKNELIRNGEVVHVGQNNFYDFDQSGGPAPQQEPFQILPGDAFRTTCNYKGTGRRFGTGSQDGKLESLSPTRDQ